MLEKTKTEVKLIHIKNVDLVQDPDGYSIIFRKSTIGYRDVTMTPSQIYSLIIHGVAIIHEEEDDLPRVIYVISEADQVVLERVWMFIKDSVYQANSK